MNTVETNKLIKTSKANLKATYIENYTSLKAVIKNIKNLPTNELNNLIGAYNLKFGRSITKQDFTNQLKNFALPHELNKMESNSLQSVSDRFLFENTDKNYSDFLDAYKMDFITYKVVEPKKEFTYNFVMTLLNRKFKYKSQNTNEFRAFKSTQINKKKASQHEAIKRAIKNEVLSLEMA